MGEPQNQNTLKSSNRARLLERIRRQPTARAELARQLGLTKSAVTLLTGEMIREGLLREAGPAEKSAAPGRTSILLDIVPDHAFAVGIALHRRVCRVCLTDLSARPIAAEELPTQALPSGDAALAQLWQTALRLMPCLAQASKISVLRIFSFFASRSRRAAWARSLGRAAWRRFSSL